VAGRLFSQEPTTVGPVPQAFAAELETTDCSRSVPEYDYQRDDWEADRVDDWVV